MANKYDWGNGAKPQQDGSWSSDDSLGRKIEIMFTRFVQRVFLWCVDFVSDRLVDIFDNAMKIMRPGVAKATDPLIQRFLADESIPDWIKKSLHEVLNEQGESSWVMKLLVLYVTILSGITGSIDPIRRIVSYRADAEFRSYLPTPQELAFMRYIQKVSPEAYKSNMAKLGVAEPLIDVYYELARRMPNIGEVMAGRWRGVLNDENFAAYLHRMGYSANDIAVYDELSHNLPPLTDLVRMLVRDAFNDSAASQYGYDEDFPDDISKFFGQQGYDPDWAKRYWRSHWQLPSPSQAYEMLHRGLITEEDLETLLRISDYPLFWRKKLEQISFNVMTRVDVRRLLQAGIIDATKALDTYKKMGYTPEDAQLLTDFAVKGISNEEKDLTKTEILNLYEEGLTDRDSTSELLVKMGYDQSEADDILKLSDVSIAKAMRTDLINYTKEKFLAKQIDEPTARNELNQIGLRSQSVDRYVMNWQRASEVESALPSFADAKRWYLAGYINESKLRLLLAQHRHTQEHIEIYVKELNDKLTAEILDEASRL